jgi:hypothetical protein
LHRALPPLPELSLSEEFVIRTANSVRLELNKALAIAHDVALGKDFKLFLKVFEVDLFPSSKQMYMFALLVSTWVKPLVIPLSGH